MNPTNQNNTQVNTQVNTQTKPQKTPAKTEQQSNNTPAQPTNNSNKQPTSAKLEKKLLQKIANDNLKPSENKTKIDKEKIMMKILKYQENKRFGDRIKKGLGIKYTRQQLLKCSIDNLESILYRIRTFLNNSNLDAVFEHMARYSATSYEELVSSFYDIEGFSDLLLSNPAFWDAFEKWKIEREMPEIPSSLQLVYLIISTTYLAHLQNRVKKQSETPIPPPPVAQSKQNDLVIIDNDNNKKPNVNQPIIKQTNNKVGQIL
jgi:hypothetical protein